MSVELYCISENEKSSNEVISPSGKYKLTIKSYKTKEGCWNYTSGSVTRVDDDSLITTINRDYSAFNHSFFNRDGVEWLWTGKTYLSQCFVNLETGEIYDNSTDKAINGSSFCWTNVMTNASGTILAVVGCIWGGPYDIIFYDFTDPAKGWPLIEFDGYQTDYDISADQDYELRWIDDTTVEYTSLREFSTRFNKQVDDLTMEELKELPTSDEEYNKEVTKKFYYRVVIENANEKMCYVTTESSDDHCKDVENSSIFDVKLVQFRSDLKASNRYRLLLEAFGDIDSDEQTTTSSDELISAPFFFCHNNKILDFDSPIEETHFGVNVTCTGSRSEIRCYADHVTVSIKGETEKFSTVQDAITYVKNREQ